MNRRTIRKLIEGKKRLIALAGLGVCLMAGLPLRAEERERIVVAGGDAFEPVMYLDDEGRPAGEHIELWKLWSEKTGVEVEIRLMDWAETIPALQAGDVDIVAGVSYTPERAAVLDFSEPYEFYDTYIFYHSSISDVSSLDDIEGFPVGVLRGSNLELQILKQRPEIHLMTYSNYRTLVRAAMDGKIRVFLGEEPVISHFVSEDGRRADFYRSETPLYSSELRHAVRKGEGELLALIEKGWSLISGEERRMLVSEWTGVGISSGIPWRWLTAALIVAAMIIGLLFLWNTSLRRRVDVATRVLRSNEQRYRGIIEDQSELIWRNKPDGTITFVNDAFCRAFGRVRDDLLNASILPLIAETDRPAIKAYFASFESKMGISTHEHRVVGVNNAVRWHQWINRAIFGDSDKVTEIQGTGRDVTDQREAEKESKLLFTAIEQAAEAIMITDAGGIIEYVNPAFERVSGYGRREAMGQTPRILRSGRHGEDFYSDMWNTLNSGKTWSGRVTNRKKDGSLFTEEVVISPLFDAKGVVTNYVSVKRDVTHESRIEEQLRQAQRMEAVGQLAGGVAHDFSNLLQAILGYADIVLESLPPGDRHRQDIEQIQRAGRRAADLTRQLLAFSRRQVIRPVTLDMNDLIDNVLKMLQRLISEDIILEVDQEDNLPHVLADPGQMEQILINLCVNSRDALPEGGTIGIKTLVMEVTDDFRSEHSGDLKDRYVCIRVSDTGCGMDEGTLSQIFEPFFTTKGVGKGTGLGLATVYGIARQHNGIIDARSQLGEGTEIDVYIPVAEATADTVHESGSEADTGGSETILVAEDDDMVRNLTTRILRRAGYTVLTADNGESAVELFSSRKDEIDLLLLDVVMPKLGGHAAYMRIKEMSPDLGVIFASGYAQDGVHTDFILNAGLDLIEKPYVPSSLLGAVRKALDSQEARS